MSAVALTMTRKDAENAILSRLHEIAGHADNGLKDDLGRVEDSLVQYFLLVDHDPEAPEQIKVEMAQSDNRATNQPNGSALWFILGLLTALLALAIIAVITISVAKAQGRVLFPSLGVKQPPATVRQDQSLLNRWNERFGTNAAFWAAPDVSANGHRKLQDHREEEKRAEYAHKALAEWRKIVQKHLKDAEQAE